MLLALSGLIARGSWSSARRELQAFLGSCAFLGGMLAATAACIFPVMLRSVGSEGQSLTAYNASVPISSLRIAFSWWIVGFPLAIFYVFTVFRIHRGKAIAASGREGY